jgi:Ca2+-binding RTX toxin-like protein
MSFPVRVRLASLLLAAAACAEPPEIADLELAANTALAYKATVRKGTLYVTGNAASSRLALRLGPTGLLEVDVGDDGTAEYKFDRSTFSRIVVDGGGGDDVIRMDESNGAFTNQEAVTLMGGDGNDTLTGGVGAETFYGGAGNDTIDGRQGNDVVFLGAGDDTFVWHPGDGSDVVEGEDGADALQLMAANIGETVELAADAGRVSLTRDIGAVAMDLAGLERVELHMMGGADQVIVDDLAGTGLARVDVDLASADGLADVVTVNGSPAADAIHVRVENGTAIAAGLAAEVRVTSGEPALDRLVVSAAAGDSVAIDGSAAADTMTLVDDGGPVRADIPGASVIIDVQGMTALGLNGLGGDDTLRVGPSVQLPVAIDGGDGSDRVEGGGGDTVRGGAGDDVLVWNPGDGSNVLEGGDGNDVLSFSGGNVSESFDLAANGARLRLTRDIASVTLDAGAVERVALRTLGGTDTVVVHDLAGTPVAAVDVDLGLDGQADVVTVAAAGAGPIHVAADGGAVVASGLGAPVRVAGGEPALDRLLVDGADVVNVDGSDGPDTMTVLTDGAAIAVQADGFDVLVDAQDMVTLAVNGLAGDDTIRAQSVVFPLVLDGGDGNDTITGGYGPDTIRLGAGDDVYTWNPGSGSDVVDGGEGADILAFNGANVGEAIALRPSAGGMRLTRNIASVGLDTAGFERVDLRLFGGADTVLVDDLSGTSVTEVNLDLAASIGGGDGAYDALTVVGSAAPDAITIGADGGGVRVAGLPATVRIAGAEPTDALTVNGGGGLDSFAVSGVDGLITLTTSQD